MKKKLDTTKFHRQLGLADPKKLYDLRVRILGVGAVGSAVAIILAKMGVGTLEIWDPDTVEAHNLPNQYYRQQDVGKPKVVALKEMLEEFGAFEVVEFNAAFDPKDAAAAGLPKADVVICAVDSMEFRKNFWEKCARLKYGIKKYIETRMGGEEFRIYSLDTMDSRAHDAYEKTLYTDEQADEGDCTEKSILFNVMGIASLVSSFVKKAAIGEADEIPYEILGNYINTLFMVNRSAPEPQASE